MWQKTENDINVRPVDKEISGRFVILRKDFRLIPASEDFPEHYEYNEWQMTQEQYEVYKNFETLINEQSDALVELAELISEVM